MASEHEWVREHTPQGASESYLTLWHWYGCGQQAMAACGKGSIEGSPVCRLTKPEELTTSVLCPICEGHWDAKQEQKGE